MNLWYQNDNNSQINISGIVVTGLGCLCKFLFSYTTYAAKGIKALYIHNLPYE